MRDVVRILVLIIVMQETGISAPGSVSSNQEGQSDRFTAVANKLVEAINASDYEAVFREFDERMKQGFPLERVKAFFQGLISQRGKIQRIDAPRLTPPDQALFLTHFERGVLDLKIILDGQNRIGGLGFLPVEQPSAAKPESKPSDPKANDTPLRLPFNGRWLVSSGGETRELNSHHDVPNQVFAFDFVGVGPDAKTETGDGRRNEDHYAFGREIIAPADGVVTDVIEGVRDNVPGSLNPFSALGNAVFIEHRGGEVSVFAHLKLGSLRVRVGDRVKAGQVIGLCGNSGNSKRPHLHYHLQQTPVIQDGQGIKVFFQNILVEREGKTEIKERYSPIRGEIVSPVAAQSQTTPPSLESADSLFRAGKFAEAEKLYAKMQADDSKNYHATVRLGSIALFANKFESAKKWLTKAVELKPEDRSAKALLAEAYYRQDDFQRAAPLYRAIGNDVMAKKLESFQGVVPYQVEGKAQVSRLKFIHTDPLPLVSVRVNNSEEVNFLIDTGGSEVYLDTEFARQVGAVEFGSRTGVFGGDQTAAVGQGRIESLTLGDFLVRNVPVHILPTRRFAGAARGKQVDGILGTVLFYHFLTTLDYPSGELILRRKTKENLKRVEQEAASEKQIVIPFWMSGSHFMVAWGRVNQSNPLLFFVDTGLAGGGFTCPQSTVTEAGIKVLEQSASEGVGGGGKMKLVPFMVEELALGDATERNIPGVFGPFPAAIEYVDGFRIGGLISHTFFRPYALTLDFTGMRLFLKRKAAS